MGINLRSEREISQMRKAGLLVWQAHQIAAPMVKPGATTADIDAAVEEFFRQQDAIPLFKNYPNPKRGKPAFPGVTCMSLNDEVVHGIPNADRPLQEGDVISIDTGCQIDGWCGDAAVTHAVGEIEPQVQNLLDVTQGVLALAIELMGQKEKWSEVAGPMAEMVAKAGFATVEEFVGHGIGRDMHESPQVPNYLSPQLSGRDDFRLRPGLVIAVEPMVNMGTKSVRMLSDYWTMVTKDRQPSAHFEHTIALTADGPRVLTGPPIEGEPEWEDWAKARFAQTAEKGT